MFFTKSGALLIIICGKVYLRLCFTNSDATDGVLPWTGATLTSTLLCSMDTGCPRRLDVSGRQTLDAVEIDAASVEEMEQLTETLIQLCRCHLLQHDTNSNNKTSKYRGTQLRDTTNQDS